VLVRDAGRLQRRPPFATEWYRKRQSRGLGSLTDVSLAVKGGGRPEPQVQQSSQSQGSSLKFSIFCAACLHLGVDCGMFKPLGLDEPGFLRDLGRLASCLNCWFPRDNGFCYWPACTSSLLRNAPAVQHQADVCVSLAARSRMPAASQFRSIGVSGLRSICVVMASDVRNLRNDGRHTVRNQSPHYVCTRGPGCGNGTSSRSGVIVVGQGGTFQMLGSRSKYSSSSFFPPSPAPNCFSDWINSIRSIHLTIL
jgi:hypothetical protein